MTVSAPAPPAWRITMFVAPLAPTDMPSTTNVSECVAAPPSLSTVSSFSVPPFGDEGAGPGSPGLARAGDHEQRRPATGLLCRSIVPELVNVCTPTKWPCNGPPSVIALLGLTLIVPLLNVTDALPARQRT